MYLPSIRKSMATNVSLSNETPKPDEEIEVEWTVGQAARWMPTTNDELRVTTGSGVVVSRVLFSDAYSDVCNDPFTIDLRTAKAKLRCPPLSGRYILSLMDIAANRRLFTMPFRVFGAEKRPPETLSIVCDKRLPHSVSASSPMSPETAMADEVSPCACITVSIGASLRNRIFDFSDPTLVILQAHKGDNDGQLIRGYFDHCQRIVPISNLTPALEREQSRKSLGSDSLSATSTTRSAAFDTTTFKLVAPQAAGVYQVRLMVTPLSRIPFTIADSPPFVVNASAPIEQMADIEGSIQTHKKIYSVGESISVRYDITSRCGGKLSPLDTIVVYPLGRSEAIDHHDGIHNIVNCPVYSQSMAIRAPKVEGYYQVAYFSFSDQRPVIIEKDPITIKAPFCQLSDASQKLTNQRNKEDFQLNGKSTVEYCCGDTILVAFKVDTSIHSPRDQLLVFDDLANVVSRGSLLTSNVDTFVNENGEPRSLCTGVFEVKIVMPGKFTIRYHSFERHESIAQLPAYFHIRNQGGPLLCPSASLQAIGLLPTTEPIELRMSKLTPDLRPDHQQAHDCISVFPVHSPDSIAARSPESTKQFPSIFTYYLRGESTTSITLPSVLEMMSRLHFSSESASESQPPPPCVALRYMCSVGHFTRICTSEVFIHIKPPSQLPSFVRVDLKYVALRDLGQVQHRFRQDGRVAPYVPPTTLISQSSQNQPQKERADDSDACIPNGGPLNFIVRSNVMQGSLVGPSDATTSERIRILHHITSGLPRSADKIMLFNRDGTRVISQCSVGLSVGTDDLTMGELLLNPPLSEGTYFAGYWSDKFQGVVLVSSAFHINNGSIPFFVESEPTKGPLRRHNQEDNIGSSGRPPRTKILVVAVSNFQREFELKGPTNDAEMFISITKQFFASEHSTVEIKKLVEGSDGEQPDCDTIRKCLRWLLDGASSGDVLLFYFSGCGTFCNGDNALVPVGYGFPDRLITLAELNKIAKRAPPEALVLMFIDACYVTSYHDVASRQEGTTGSVESHALMSIKRRRKKRGIAADSPWRSMAPPPGMTKQPLRDLGLGSLQPAGFMLPYTQVSPTSPQKTHSNIVIYEASNGTYDFPQGSWDAFDTRTGRTVGIFSRALCTVFEQELGAKRSKQLSFLELHERVGKLMQSSAHPQSPRILVPAANLLGQPLATK